MNKNYYVRIIMLITIFASVLMMTKNVRAENSAKIKEIKEYLENNTKWEENFIVNGEKIDVNIDIITPEGDKLPIIEVVPVHPYGEIGYSELGRLDAYIQYNDIKLEDYLNIEGEKGITLSIFDEIDGIRRMWINTEIDAPRMKMTSKMKYSYVTVYPSSVELNEVYAEDNKKSAEEAVNYLHKILEFYFGKNNCEFTVEFFEIRDRARKVKGLDDYNLGEKVELYPMGTYYLGIRQCIESIPIYIDMGVKQDLSKFDGMIWGRFWPIWGINEGFFEYMNDNSFELSICWFEEKRILESDVTLTSVQTIIDCLKEEINKGHIKNIYALKLGYACYLNKDDMNSYILKPVWICDCDYVESSKDEITKNIYSDDFRKGNGFTQILIDAQNGEILKNKISNLTEFYACQ